MRRALLLAAILAMLAFAANAALFLRGGGATVSVASCLQSSPGNCLQSSPGNGLQSSP